MRSIHVETVCVWNINQVAIKFKFRNIIDIYPLKCQSHPSIRNVKFNHLCALKVKKKTSKYFCLLQRENIMFCIEFPPYPFAIRLAQFPNIDIEISFVNVKLNHL